MDTPWDIWIDTGGTFTDCVARGPDGTLRRAKVLSSGALRGRVEGVGAGGDMLFVEADWGAPSRFIVGMEVRFPGLEPAGSAPARAIGHDAAGGVIRLDRAPGFPIPPGAVFEVRSGEEAPILAARLVTGTHAGRPLPPVRVRLGTTRATNALLERRGEPVALFLTRGHGDLLEIGTQQRPDLFALDIVKPAPLHAAVVEVPERLGADGSVLAPLDLAALAGPIARARGAGLRSAAVALLHAWINPVHERALGAFLAAHGFEHISLSSDLAPLIRLLPRAQTAVVNAYLAPVVESYLGRVAGGLAERGSRLHVTTSAGGLFDRRSIRAKDTLLSGPAGGVVGAALAARRSGFGRAISLDMGGTSTDVARVDAGAGGTPLFDYDFEHEVAGVRVLAPALAIETVAAGGGSICTVDAQGLRVGPESAGADPGPACYGAGGPLTITDCNLLLGRLDPAAFAIPIDAGAARARFEELRDSVGCGPGTRRDSVVTGGTPVPREQVDTGGTPVPGEGGGDDPDALLEGLIDLACERMAEAIRGISIRRGYDPSGDALLAFGGAGGQHACAVAERLGMGTVLIPADAGLLSALGVGRARIERMTERQVLERLDAVAGRLDGVLDDLAGRAADAIAGEGIAPERIAIARRIASVRLLGQESAIAIDLPEGSRDWRGYLAPAFAARYADIHGHAPPERPSEVESLRVVATEVAPAESDSAPGPATAHRAETRAEPGGVRRVGFAGRWLEARVFERARLAPGDRLDGPALVFEAHAATVVAPGWRARVDGACALVLTRSPSASPARSAGHEAVRAELAIGRLTAIAREMGEQLRRTALSVNVKERLDFSCALLDPAGTLIASAPHIPVHLGALGTCVRALRGAIELGPGDTVVTNHPAFGGSHLPDITLVTPVHGPGGELLGFVANRAHHAEIGSARPGSMPTEARTLADEGVVIAPMHLVRADGARWGEAGSILRAGRWPSRAVEENLADLRAQLGANRRGHAALVALAREIGEAELGRSMRLLTDRSARRVRAALARLAGGGRRVLEAEERLDDGAILRVRLELAGDRGVLDFAGSAGVHPGNLNATPAIVRSVVAYVMRLLVDEPLPLNEGLVEPVEIRVGPGILHPPFDPDPARCPAVVGGNTETSQRLVDALIKALGLAACSQGTMNNLVLGNARFSHYETIGGGAGATPLAPGASGVHTHMTNTRITDPEVLERRCPVRLERFAIRNGSGGAGRQRGGDGLVRELTLLEPCSVSLLGQHRREGPYGAAGGEAGRPGAQRLVQADGRSVELPGVASVDVRAGDRLVIETPGGGGWGRAGA